MNTYYYKYLKYKKKYLELKKQKGGGRLVQIHSLIPEITLEPIDLSSDDDIYVLKQQILQQLRRTGGESTEPTAVQSIDYDDFEVVQRIDDRCTGRVIQSINPEISKVCVRMSQRADPKKFVPSRLTSGLRFAPDTILVNKTGTFNFSNCKFSGVIEEGRVNKINGLFIVKGHGLYTTSDGSVVEGTFINDKIEGQVIIRKTNGDVIEGLFRDNQLNGPGRITRASGEILEGDFVSNNIVSGTIIKPNGDRFEGHFVNKKLKGSRCRVILSDGTVKTGEFDDNKLVSGKIIYSNGNEDSGEFVDELLNGVGTKIVRTSPESEPITYYGEFALGELNGLAKITYPDGRIEEGEYSNGTFIRPSYKTEITLHMRNDVKSKNLIENIKGYDIFKNI